MTDADPRFDPAYQRGFAGGTDRLTDAERPFARPGEPDAAPRRARRVAPPGAELRRAVEVDDSRLERAREGEPEVAGAAVVLPIVDTMPDVVPVTLAVAPAPRLRSNPWFLALIGAGAAGSILGFVLLYWALATPISTFAGSAANSNAYVLHQMVYYLSVPLLGCLPTAGLIALALVAARWRGRLARTAPPEPDDAPEVTIS